MNDRYLKPSQVAKIFQISTRTVIHMIEDGRIRAVTIRGNKRNTYRILEKELDRFVAEEYERQSTFS